MKYLNDVDQILVRPYAELEGSTYYLIYDRTRGMVHEILYNAEIEHVSQTVKIVALTGKILYTAKGGLYSQKEKMVISSPFLNREVGEVSDQCLTDKLHRTFYPLKWSGPLTPTSKATLPQKLFVVEDNTDSQEQTEACGISIHNNSQALVCTYNCRDVKFSEWRKVLILLAGFKAYYSIFSMQSLNIVVPKSLLAKMPSATPWPVMLHTLDSLNHIIFRPAFYDRQGRVLVDVLNFKTHEIELIVEKSQSSQVVFKNAFGVLQFSGVRQLSKDKVEQSTTFRVFDHLQSAIGHTKRYKEKKIISYYDKNGVIVMKSTVAKVSLTPRVKKENRLTNGKIIYHMENAECAAEQHRDCESNTSILWFNTDAKLSPLNKALLLFTAAHDMDNYFHILDHNHLPTVACYPYRQIKV